MIFILLSCDLENDLILWKVHLYMCTFMLTSNIYMFFHMYAHTHIVIIRFVMNGLYYNS